MNLRSRKVDQMAEDFFSGAGDEFDILPVADTSDFIPEKFGSDE